MCGNAQRLISWAAAVQWAMKSRALPKYCAKACALASGRLTGKLCVALSRDGVHLYSWGEGKAAGGGGVVAWGEV